MQDNTRQQACTETNTPEKNTEDEKPVPAKRQKKKKQKLESLPDRTDMPGTSGESIEERKLTVKADDALPVMTAVRNTINPKVETLDIETWKVDMFRFDEKQCLSDTTVKISSEGNITKIEGEEEQVTKINSLIGTFEQNIGHRQIQLGTNTRLREFLMRESVTGYIRQLLETQKLNCHWELDKNRPVIDVYVFPRERLQMAFEIIGKCYREEVIQGDGKNLLYYLRRSTQWQESVYKLTNGFEQKVGYTLSDCGYNVIVLCTRDLETVAADQLRKTEEMLQTDSVLKLDTGKLMLLNQVLCGSEEGVKVTPLSDKTCLFFDGKKENVQKAKNSVLNTVRKIKHSEVAFPPIVPLNYFERNSVISYIDKKLENHNIKFYWQVNEINYVVDVFAFDSDTVRDICSTFEQTVSLQTLNFDENPETFKQFKSHLDDFSKKHEEKIEAFFGENTNSVTLLCTSDLWSEIRELRNECENIIFDFPCADIAVFDYLQLHSELLEEIGEKHCIGIEACNSSDKGPKFVVKCKKGVVEAAQKALQYLVQHKISKSVIKVSMEAFHKFQNSDNEKVCADYKVNLGFDNATFDVMENEIILTNRQSIPDAKSQSAVVILKEELNDGEVEVEQKGSYYIIYCSQMNVKLGGGKDITKQQKVFENILDAAVKRKLCTVFIPLDDIAGSVGTKKLKKFVKLFVKIFCEFSRRMGAQIPDIEIQISDRTAFHVARNAVRSFLISSSQGTETVYSKPRKTKVIPVRIEEGELAKIKADVIVNSVGTQLDLSNGAITKALLEAAGQGIQLEIQAKRPYGLALWQMVETEGHNLLCIKVYHVVLDGFHNETAKASESCLQSFAGLVKKCLYEMDKSGFRTIAFPVLGTGALKYKDKDVANVMVTALGEYSIEHPTTSIQEVIIVVYSQKAKKVIEKRLESYPNYMFVEKAEEAKEDYDTIALAVVGQDNDVARAKECLTKQFGQKGNKTIKAAKKTKKSSKTDISESDTKSDKEQTRTSERADSKTYLKTRRERSPQRSGDLSELDKMLSEVRVEFKETFVRKLPENSFLKKEFKVILLNEENKCWLKGKLSDLEKVREFLKTGAVYPPDQHCIVKDLTKEVFGLVCSKLNGFEGRLIYDSKTNKATILKNDKESQDLIESYINYQFDELIPKSYDTVETRASHVENDKIAAELLKRENFNQFQSVEFYVSSMDKILVIAAPDYDILSKFKGALEVKTGRKQVRGRYGRTDTATDPLRYTTHSDADHLEAKVAAFATHKGEPFKTREDIHVYVYRHDILKLNVDCIVNAANREMKHGGGVAQIIADAAGNALEKESRDYIVHNGKLRVGSCCTTTAGNLHYKRIIHTVGPDIKYYKRWEYDRMRNELRRAVRVCFETAESFGFFSIGMTSISSGVYGVPKQWCAQEYANAVYAYSRDHGRATSLKEIHFVDVSDEMLFEINQAFHHTFKEGSQIERRGCYKNGGTIASSSEYDVLKRERDNGARAKYCQNQYPKGYSKENKYIIELSKVLKVMIYTDDVTAFKAGVICCSQDAQLGSTGRVASAIRKSAGPLLEASLVNQKLKRPSVGGIVVTEPGNMRCASIFHVISPDFKALAAQSVSDAFLSQVERGYFNCLQEANQRGVQKIAIPLFGCGILGGHLDKLAKTFQSAVVRFCSGSSSHIAALREIHAVNDFPVVTHMIKTAFIEYVEETPKTRKADDLAVDSSNKYTYAQNNSQRVITDSTPTRTLNPKKSRKKGNEMQFYDVDVSADETCTICMDRFENPKKLPKCSHYFCSECIDAQFKVNTRCPVCFTVYGIITGDQPDGEMSYYTDSMIRLSGYEDYGAIVIRYWFSDGIQESSHPQPGATYKGISRKGYLPDNEDGRLIVKMLKVAFERKLVFTIGSSRTTGHEGVITWNDIHHKTDPRPGSTFGYPDPGYLDRVKDELAAKGVTPDDVL